MTSSVSAGCSTISWRRGGYRLRSRLPARPEARKSPLHPAAGQEIRQPVDVVVAVDDVLLAHQGAKQRQGRIDPVHDELVERALEPHQAFAAGLAMDDELADQRIVERRDRVAVIDR